MNVRTRTSWGRIALALLILASGSTISAVGASGGMDEGFEALEARFEAARKEEGVRAATQAFQEDFEKLAKSAAGTEDGLRADLWVLRMRWWERSSGNMEKNAGPHARRLIAEYPKSPLLHRIPEFDYLYSVEDLRDIAKILREVSPHRTVHAKSHFALAKKLRRSDALASKKELQILARDFAELPYRETTYGEIADAYMNPHDPADLEIGKPAPEIIGADVNGQAMRLSDYKGKVILLDFWGDW